MNPGMYKSNSNVTAASYKKQEILMSTPEQCVLHVYDIAIQSCTRKESVTAGRAVAALIDALDFDRDADLAGRLFRLYEFCLSHIHRQQYDHPVTILKQLRQTWQQVIGKQAAA